MKRFLALVVLAAAVVCPSPARADVTMTMTMSTTGPVSMEMTQVVYIKGTKMRTDVTLNGRTMSTIVDAAARQMIVLDPAAREATVYDLSRMADQMQKEAGVQGTKVSVTPNGETKQLLGRTCTGYNLSITVPVAMGANTVTLNIGGPVWVAKDAPGTTDFATFFKAAGESGLFVAPPAGRGGPANPGMNERGMALMYKALAETGGIPYEQVMTLKTDATGPGADMMRRMGPGETTVTTLVTSISTDPVPADKFEIPAGFTKKTG
jgi:hypothetical protein